MSCSLSLCSYDTWQLHACTSFSIRNLATIAEHVKRLEIDSRRGPMVAVWLPTLAW